MKRIPPALALFLIAPIFGELFSGSSPLNEYVNPVTFVTLGLLYGCGAIIVRELVVRWDRGWLSLLALGAAYGIYEEGVLVQSFFDPGWIDLGALAVYGRALGVNWVWTEHLVIFHMLISIAASIAFVEALYPDRRRERWVNSRGWWISNWIGALGLVVPWKLLVTYDAGLWWLAAWLSVFGVGVLARFLPSAPLPEAAPRSVPRPRRFFLTGLLGWLVQFVLVYNSAESGALPFLLTMLIVLTFDLFIAWLLLRWSGNGRRWDDRHRLALVIGSLSLFLVFGMLNAAQISPLMYYSNPVFLFLLWLAYRSVDRRVQREARP